MRIHRIVSSLAKSKWNFAEVQRLASSTRRPFASVAPDAATTAASSRPVPQLEKALQLADKIVGNSASSTHSLQHVLNEEVSVVTQILRKLVGTNHSLSEIEK